MIEIYTDGSCKKNPGPGGWGLIIIDTDTNEVKAYGCQYNHTTNNRMELRALLVALRRAADLCDYRVNIFSDSAYCVNMCNGWIFGWAQNGWSTKDKKPVKNLDLVKAIYQFLAGFPNFTITQIKGHTGIVGNELADAMATNNIERFTKICKQNNLTIIECEYGEGEAQENYL